MRIIIVGLVLLLGGLLVGCKSESGNDSDMDTRALAEEVKEEAKRSWEAIKLANNENDDLADLHPPYLDAYSRLYIMGLNDEAEEIEEFILNNLDVDQDIFIETLTYGTRVVASLVSQFDLTQNPDILDKAIDAADRMLPAFDSPTGLPYQYVNLKTGETKGDTITQEQAVSYAVELGALSYYTQNPVYYQTAKKAVLYLYNNQSEFERMGDSIRVTSGTLINVKKNATDNVDVFFDYAYKCWTLFGDSDMLLMSKKPSKEKIEKRTPPIDSMNSTDDYNDLQGEIKLEAIESVFHSYSADNNQEDIVQAKIYWELMRGIVKGNYINLKNLQQFYLLFRRPDKYSIEKSVYTREGYPLRIGNYKEYEVGPGLGI